MVEPKTGSEYVDLPKIRAGGKEWPVPLFAPKQNRVIVPMLVKLKSFVNPADLDEDKYNQLLQLVYLALTRAHPELTKDEFDDMALPVDDMLAAFPVIAAQTGMVKLRPKKEPGEGGPDQPGEDQANRQIGTE